MAKKKKQEDSGAYILIIMVLVVGALIYAGVVGVTEVIKYESYCNHKGYFDYNLDYIEPGYVECLNYTNTTVDHRIVMSNVSEIFFYEKGWRKKG